MEMEKDELHHWSTKTQLVGLVSHSEWEEELGVFL